MAERTTHYTTDHDTILAWSTRHGGRPAILHDTIASENLDQLAIVLPGERQDHAELIDWDRFFQLFDRGNQVFVFSQRAEQRRSAKPSLLHQVVPGEAIALLRLRQATGREQGEGVEERTGPRDAGERAMPRGRTTGAASERSSRASNPGRPGRSRGRTD